MVVEIGFGGEKVARLIKKKEYCRDCEYEKSKYKSV